MNSELKPKIRFKGFTDDWEQRKLNEITDVRDGTHDSPKYIEYGHPFITSKNIKNGFIDYSDIQYISDADFKEINKRSKVDINDILFGMIGTIGNIALIRENPTFAIKNVALVKDIHKINYLYLYQYLQSNNITKQFEENVDGGTQKFIALNKVRELIIDYPQSDEQLKIGDFLEQIDNLITLHQRKCGKLVELKKSLLEKMFPQNNSVIPEIRFKGFNDDWEQCKYKDIGIPLSGGKLSYDSLDDDGDKKCVLYGDLYTKYDCIIQDIKNRTFEVGNSIIKNDILFPQSTTVDAYSLISPACLNEENAETSGVFVIRPYKNINGNFICYYTKGNIEQRKKLSKKAQGLTIVHLYYHSIKEEFIMIPHKDEQDKIASVLLDLDNLITLHQRKHDKLNKIKQSLLNDMFV